MNSYRQLSVFPEANETEEPINVTVIYWPDNNTYQALIADGWWTATARTQRQAVKAVMKRYEDELDWVRGPRK